MVTYKKTRQLMKTLNVSDTLSHCSGNATVYRFLLMSDHQLIEKNRKLK